MNETLIMITGYAASVCMILGFLPQALHTIRTRDTDGIATGTFLLFGFGSVIFMIQGFLMSDVPLILTNAIMALSSATVFGVKMKNDARRRRKMRMERASVPAGSPNGAKYASFRHRRVTQVRIHESSGKECVRKC